MYTIYALVDPRTGQIRYVGQTQNHPEVRLDGHLQKPDENKAKQAWFDELRYLHLKPTVVVLEYAPDLDEALEVERDWIRRGRRSGWHLLNCIVSKRRERSEPLEPKPRLQRLPVIKYATPRRWDDVVAAWFDANPQAMAGPAKGISDLARAMCRDNEGGSDANYEAYKGRAHALFHDYRNGGKTA